MTAPEPGHRWKTWSGTVGCRPAELLTPTTEESVIAAVRAAAAHGIPVRVAGSGALLQRSAPAPTACCSICPAIGAYSR